MDVTQFILQSLYFMLPAYVANVAPVLFRGKFKKLAKPIDEDFFGKNKTYRGFIVGVPLAILTAYLQYIFPSSLALFDYSNWLLIGFLLGKGALLGDLVESFFKRKNNVKPGQSWKVFDQIDFVLGALLLSSIAVNITSYLIIVTIISSFVVTVVANHLAYYLGIRKVRW